MKRLVITCIAAAVGIVAAAGVARANLLDDGNFSAATSGTQTSNSAWVLTANAPDGTNESARFQTGFANAQNTGVGGSEAPGVGTGVWFRSFEGNQAGGGDPLATAALTQGVSVTNDGDYQLTFAAGRETNFTASEFFVMLSSSGTGGSDMVNLLTATIPNGNLGGAASTNPGGTPFTLMLTGVTAGDTLTVQASMINGQDALVNPQSAFLDSFSLVHVPIPEPSSIALLVIGSTALLCRRRSSAKRV